MAFKPPASLGQILAFDHAADTHVGDFNHQAHRPHIGDQSVEFVRVLHFGDPLKVFKELDLLGFALGFGGGSLGVGDVAGNLAQIALGRGGVRAFGRIDQQRLKRAVHDQVGIAADRTGEVAVVALGKAVVADWLRE
jgi:hypothetical protein